jgi:hypothetical protein
MVMLSSSQFATAFSPAAFPIVEGSIHPMAPKITVRGKRKRGT